MVSQVQKLKTLVAVKVGSRRPYTVNNAGAHAALDDGVALLDLRRKIDLELARCRKTLAAFVAREGAKAPGMKLGERVRVGAGGAYADITFRAKGAR